MMHVDELMPSKYVKHSDLKGRFHEVVIERMQVEEVGQQKEKKPVLYFVGKQKGMVLNVGKLKMLKALHGPQTDHWSGKAVSIGPGKTMFQGQMVDCINIAASLNKQAQSIPEPTALDEADVDDDMNDEIPF